MDARGPSGVRRIVAVLIALVVRWREADEAANVAHPEDMETYKPIQEYVRGPLKARIYHEAVHPIAHQYRVWCEINIRGEPYKPLSSDFSGCSLGPVVDPPAATLLVAGGFDGGLYLLRLPEGRPTLDKLSDWPAVFDGRWTSNGRTYVRGRRAYDVVSGAVRELPLYAGDFLSFDPAGDTLVSVSEDDDSSEIILHQIDLSTGSDNPVRIQRAEHSWLSDDTHVIPGTVESAHLWKASHLRWFRTNTGRYRFNLPPRRSG